MPSRTIVNIKYSKNQDGEVDKNSTIVNLNDIRREIEDILKATKNGVVIQFPKSGGGFGTFFVHDNFTDSRYVHVNVFIASLNCYTISDPHKRDRMEGLLVAPEVEVVDGPSISFEVRNSDVLNLDFTDQILEPPKNQCVGIVFPATDINTEDKDYMIECATKWAKHLGNIGFEGHTNLDFNYIIDENGKKVLVVVESNSRRTASINVRNIAKILQERNGDSDIEGKIISQVFDHYLIPQGFTTQNIIDTLKGANVKMLDLKNGVYQGVALQTAANPGNSPSLKYGEVSLMIFADNYKKVSEIDQTVKKIFKDLQTS